MSAAAGSKVQDHYASTGIAARILAALKAAVRARLRPMHSPRWITSTAEG
jgi:hypothetical protein